MPNWMMFLDLWTKQKHLSGSKPEAFPEAKQEKMSKVDFMPIWGFVRDVARGVVFVFFLHVFLPQRVCNTLTFQKTPSPVQEGSRKENGGFPEGQLEG